MPSCCVDQSDYRRFFRGRVARRDANRYRRKGLDGVSRRLVAAVRARGVDGATVLEAGGGVGAIQLELLAAGAARATSVELSAAYEPEALSLLRERGLEERVERVIGDFVVQADELADADVVVLNRAVCCYPDGRAFIEAAAARARRVVALSLPRERSLTRLGVRAVNLFLRLRGCGFRTFVHPVGEVLAAGEARGFRTQERDRGFLWEVVVLERV